MFTRYNKITNLIIEIFVLIKLVYGAHNTCVSKKVVYHLRVSRHRLMRKTVSKDNG